MFLITINKLELINDLVVLQTLNLTLIRFITVLNGRAKNSSAIVFLRPCHNCENTQIFDIFSAAFLTFETLINDEVNQV